MYALFYYMDFDSCEKGGYRTSFMRMNPFWKFYKEYFPCKLVKTADIDSNKNYILCSSPHGVLGFGLIGNVVTESNGFSKLFPNLKIHLMTLKFNFLMPFTREYNLSFGMSVASRRAFKYILGNRGHYHEKGQVCVLVPGGAEESMHISKTEYFVYLNKRKGFCKIALETGASLIPSFTFGENDLYNHIDVKSEKFKTFQQKFKKFTTFGLPLIWGRGIFNYTFGILPHRRELITVIGKPIDVEKAEHPTHEQIDELHQRYKDELKKLFDEHKLNYEREKTRELIFV